MHAWERIRSKAREKVSGHRLWHWQAVSLLLACYDAVAVNAAFLAALWLRFDCRYSAIPEGYLRASLSFAPLYTAVCILVFWFFRLYKSIWRFAGFSECVRALMATAATGAFHAVGITLLYGRMPVSYYIIGIMGQFLLVLGVRLLYRAYLTLRGMAYKGGTREKAARVMLIGAGDAGRMVLKDISSSREVNDRVVCIIDDNPNKWGRFVEGVPVKGGRDDILVNAERYRIDKIYMAIPTATAQQKRDILDICKETGCELKALPGIYQLVNGEATVSAMREVAVEDLLGREPVRTDLGEVYRFLNGKTVLVTGGGGSIGSELCRQIAAHGPRQLIIFDVYENNAYTIQLELKEKYPGLDLEVLIGSVRDSRRLWQVFGKYRPEVVYHAAAHKHVPLMEDSPCEAIKNNTVGTYKTAYAAAAHGCERFVLVSTDKAVNPTNIMGASKRLCEMVVQAFDRMAREGRAGEIPELFTHGMPEEAGGNTSGAACGNMPGTGDRKKSASQAAPRIGAASSALQGARTEFVAVRFGNVLGSNGSVVPLFKEQIAKGGPVTVTHPDIIRYFMTIPEAVSLVLQAGLYGQGGEIFVLDMGEPVKIDTLARNLIKLSGYRPDVDIKVEYTGLRPGEKLYEERLMAEEGLRESPNGRIHVGAPLEFDEHTFLVQLGELMEAAYENRDDIRELVARIVATYHPEQGAVPAGMPKAAS